MNFFPEYLSSSDEDDFGDNDEFRERLKFLQEVRLFNFANETLDPEIQQKSRVYDAISRGDLETVCRELDEGLNIDADLRDAWTPLLLAASTAKPEITRELLRRGADTTKTIQNCTVLMLACDGNNPEQFSSRLETVEALVEYGVDLEAFDRKRKTAFMAAAESGNLELVKYLMRCCNKDAEDNQKWNILFWAVSGKNIEVVRYLLEEGFDPSKLNIGGQSPKDLANAYGYDKIADLFPAEEESDYIAYLSNKPVNYQEMFENLKEGEQPRFFEDICRILYSVGNESIIPKLAHKDITLGDFLSVTDEELKELGLEIPFQRTRILYGLYKFHQHLFHTKSIGFVPKYEKYSNIDVSRVVLSAVKQVIAMEASFKFMTKHYCQQSLSPLDMNEILENVKQIEDQIKKLQFIIEKLKERIEWWDYSLSPTAVDLITKKRRNIPWVNLVASIFVLTTFIIYKFWK